MCERQAIDGITHAGCQTRYSLDGLTALYRYDGPVKASIKRLKYKPYLAELAAILVGGVSNNSAMQSPPQRDPAMAGQFNNFTVVSVPLHSQRERERGFNQAALIGKAIAQRLSLEFQGDVLVRTRETKPQVELRGDERRKNLIDAFILNTKYKIHNTNFLLIDDVWTTGSTLRSCGNVLKRAGAKNVWAMTIAR